jgi:hypothetical protein
VSYLVEPEEVYIFHIVWNYVGTCSVKVGTNSRSIQDHNNYRARTSYVNHILEGNVGSYRLLQKIYQIICADHNIYEKVTKEGSEVSMERGLSEGVGHLEKETGNHANFDLSEMEQRVPCTCRCIIHSIGNNTIST